jgi:DNA transformation protein
MAARRMADEDFVAFVLDELAEMGEVTARAMFGGHGLYCGDVFFAIVSRARLYLKVDDESRADYEAEGMGPFRASERQTIRTYYEVPADVIESRQALVEWARRAVQAARAAGSP